MSLPNISNDLKQYGSYGLHKILVSGEIVNNEYVRIVSLAHHTSSGTYLCLYQILSKYFKH